MLRNISLFKQALLEHGITDPRGQIVLQNARFTFKDDPTMNQLTVYMRQDRSTAGTLFCGADAPDANLCTLEGKKVTFHQYMKQISSQPGRDLQFVVLVGSVS